MTKYYLEAQCDTAKQIDQQAANRARNKRQRAARRVTRKSK